MAEAEMGEGEKLKGETEYHAWLMKKLANPSIALSYLEASSSESPAQFLKATLRIVEAQPAHAT